MTKPKPLTEKFKPAISKGCLGSQNQMAKPNAYGVIALKITTIDTHSGIIINNSNILNKIGQFGCQCIFVLFMKQTSPKIENNDASDGRTLTQFLAFEAENT